jgi:hypothetical protein
MKVRATVPLAAANLVAETIFIGSELIEQNGPVSAERGVGFGPDNFTPPIGGVGGPGDPININYRATGGSFVVTDHGHRTLADGRYAARHDAAHRSVQIEESTRQQIDAEGWVSWPDVTHAAAVRPSIGALGHFAAVARGSRSCSSARSPLPARWSRLLEALTFQACTQLL